MNQTNRNQPGRFFEENYRLAAEQEGLFALDTYSDNLCLLRCIAVHQGSYPIVAQKKQNSWLENSTSTMRVTGQKPIKKSR